MIVRRRSIIDNTESYMDLNVTQDQLDIYAKGETLIQRVFPDLHANERKFIKSGITPKQWDYLFGDKEEEDD